MNVCSVVHDYQRCHILSLHCRLQVKRMSSLQKIQSVLLHFRC